MAAYLKLLSALIMLCLPVLGLAAPRPVLETDEITVVFDTPLKSAADQVIRLYPKLRLEVEEFFGWEFDIKPRVVLVSSNRKFQDLSGNEYIVAFAVPGKRLIVIDYSRMNMHPFTLEITLKHELCHLMLHRYIDSRNLPKWIDEGVSQWASDGVGEIFIDKSWSGLDAAVLAGRIIPLRRLTDHFPRDRASLTLAYEQSKSLINFIDRRFGYPAILEILDFLKNGETVEYAVMGSLGVSVDQLEAAWREQLETTPRWLIFLASHLYAILFFLAAVLTMFGFMRLHLKRKRIYRQWEEDEEYEDE